MPTVGAGGGCRGLSEVPGAGRPCHASACRSDRPPRTEPSREPRPRSPRAAAVPRREGQPHRRCRRVVDGGRRARRAAVGVRDRRAQRRSRSVAARPRGGRGHLDRRLPAVWRRARGHLGRRPRRAGRGRARRRGAHQGEPRAAGPDGQPPPVAAGRTQLRVVLRGSLAGRPAGGRVREGRAVAGCGHDRQALRRQRVRDRADERELGDRRAHVARAVPAAVRARRARRRLARDHDVLQPGERRVRAGQRRAARGDPAGRVGLRRLRRDRLVRARRHRRRGTGRSRPRDAGPAPVLRPEAGRRGAVGRGGRVAGRRGRHAPARGVRPDRRARRSARRRSRLDRQARAPGRRPPGRRGEHRAAGQRGRAPTRARPAARWR